jgi:uncharacterized membrane protein (UPF0182 family)
VSREFAQSLSYQLPKEKLVYGPHQIEAMISQNTTIFRQLTLRDQRGDVRHSGLRRHGHTQREAAHDPYRAAHHDNQQ